MEMVLRNLGRITITFFQENGLGERHSDLSMSLKYLEYFKIKGGTSLALQLTRWA